MVPVSAYPIIMQFHAEYPNWPAAPNASHSISPPEADPGCQALLSAEMDPDNRISPKISRASTRSGVADRWGAPDEVLDGIRTLERFQRATG